MKKTRQDKDRNVKINGNKKDNLKPMESDRNINENKEKTMGQWDSGREEGNKIDRK